MAPVRPLAWLLRMSRWPLAGRFLKNISPLEVNRLEILFRHRGLPILLHGTDPNWRLCALLTLGLIRSLSWVCWGNVPKLTAASPVQKLRKAWFCAGLRRMTRIVCLLEGDAKAFREELDCPRAMVLSYVAELTANADPSLLVETPSVSPVRILLGNNAHYLDRYSAALDLLAPFKENIVLTSMLNYGPKEGFALDAFEAKAQSMLGDAYRPWKSVVPINEYVDVLKKHDIYLCNVDSQTGLGAIYHMLLLGKKLFLQGINLEWVRKLGFIAFGTETIETTPFEEWSRPLDASEKRHNFDRMRDQFDVTRVSGRWEDLYRDLAKEAR